MNKLYHNHYYEQIAFFGLVILIGLGVSCNPPDDPVLTGNIEGTVTNALSSGSGTPIPNTSVTLSGASTGSITTGTDGSYRFENLTIGDYTVAFSHPDFEPGESKSLTVRSLETANGDLALQPIPAITVAQSSLDFGDAKSEISLTFKNVLSTEISYEMEAPSSWIVLSKTTGTLGSQNTATILVTVDREKMSLGLNEGAMTINIPGRASTPLVITALNNPITPIEISPTQLDFGSDQDERTLTLTNTNNSDISFEISKSADWININKSSGTIKGLLQDLINVTVNRSAVTEGDYDGTIVFNIPGSGAITVQVLMTKSPLSSIEINPNELDFKTTDLSGEITLKNPNNVDIDYTAINNTDWVSLNKTTGSISANGETKITVTIDRSQLDAGNYQETITFNSPSAGTVNLTVLAEKLDATSALLQISQSTIDFGEDQTSTDLLIENIGSAVLSWTLDVSDSWLSASKVSGTLAVSSNETIQIFVVKNGLTNGNYDGTLSFSGNGGTVNLAVSMVVDEAGSGGGDADDDNDGIINSIDADDDNDGLIDIYYLDELDAIRDDPNASGNGLIGGPASGFIGYELIRNLDFENVDHYKNASLKSQFTTGNGWLPIGYNTSGLNTLFEGNNFSIKNLTINRTTDFSALFAGITLISEIRNLHLTIKYLSGNYYTAGFVGTNYGRLDGCSVTGVITKCAGSSGLLIGRNRQGKIINCYAEGAILQSGSYTGGLIGYLGRNSSDTWLVENCFAKVDVVGHDYVGGLIGARYQGSGTVTSCYSIGNVNATGQQVGGLIGSFSGDLISSYATGQVTSNEFYVGGLVGWMNAGSINSCYSTGSVTASSNYGGLLGRNNGGSISSANYWDIEASGIETSAGDATGQTTANLQGVTSNISIYATWDPDIWDFGSAAQYPALKNMPGGLEAQR